MTLKIPDKFAKDQHVIKKLYSDDDVFRSIYKDYLMCIEAQEYWRQSDSDDATTRRIEYSNLVGELETELKGHHLTTPIPRMF
jgi:hypothetical protein